MFNPSRDQARQIFFDTWRKSQGKGAKALGGEWFVDIRAVT